MGNSTFFDELGFSFASLSDGEKRLLDMLGSEDMYNHPTSIYDLIQLPSMEVQLQQQQQQQPLASSVAETSEVLNDAETPNSSSICTSSPDALKDDDQQSKRSQVLGNNKKMPKSEKKITKKQREPRFAFMTKTDIDNLDDGFRWRKYGQKAVKNSPFPRSYYRCTSTSCGVLKRVERSSTDPSIVVTTYEGNHKHLCPVTHPGAIAILQERPCPFPGDAYSIQQSQYQQLLQLQQQGYATSPTSFPNLRATSYSPLDVPNHVAEETHLSFSPSCLFRDQGLLQDMVSSRMQSEE